MSRQYHACLNRVSEEHGHPPVEFLDQIVDTLNRLPDDVFSENQYYDIYSAVSRVLGPWTSLLHRKAVMCEVLRVVAAFESDWHWNAGVDTHNPNSVHDPRGEETGAFQVSWDSLVFDQ